MKYDEIVSFVRLKPIAPRLIRREDAGVYLSAPKLLAEMEEAGWISPVVQRNRMTLFDVRQLDACVDRLAAGESPKDFFEPPAGR